MAVSSIGSPGNSAPASQLLSQVAGQHRHRGRYPSLDADAQSLIPAPAQNAPGNVGSKLDVTA